MNPKDIASKKFEKGFGYKQEEVDAYLKEVAVALATAMKEKEESEAKIVKLVEKINEYRSDEDAIRDVLLVAQKQGKRIIADAKDEAAKIVADAQTKRDSLLAEISNDCEALKRSQIEKIAIAIKEENEKYNAVVAASKTQTELQTDKLNKLKLEVNDFKKKLLVILEEQVKIAASLPELTDEEIQKIISGQIKPAAPEPAPVQANAPQTAAQEPSKPSDIAKAAMTSPSEAQKKPINDKMRSVPAFSFGDGHRKQEFSSSDLKFGQNQNNNNKK